MIDIRRQPVRASAAVCALVLACGAGCGGSKAKPPQSHAWRVGSRLGSHGVLGDCATALGPNRRLLIVCRSRSSTAFASSCWSVSNEAGIATGAWSDASGDPGCEAAQRAAAAAGLFK